MISQMWYSSKKVHTHIVREFLDMHFPGRWVGRDEPNPWPPRSPGITPLDFFLWGYVTGIEYGLDALHDTKGAHVEVV
jgi:hypothetical protein